MPRDTPPPPPPPPPLPPTSLPPLTNPLPPHSPPLTLPPVTGLTMPPALSNPLPPPSALLPPPQPPQTPFLTYYPRRPATEKRCGWCATTSSSQWRVGQTDGKPEFGVLCNACGINYRRALTKASGKVNLDELARSMGSISPKSRPSIHKTLKRQRAAAAAAAATASAASSRAPSTDTTHIEAVPLNRPAAPYTTGAASASASASAGPSASVSIGAGASASAGALSSSSSSSSRKRPRYSTNTNSSTSRDALPPFEDLVRSIPDSSPDPRPP